MRSGEKAVQKRVALALAHLCSADDRKTIFIDNNGLELLLDLLESTNKKQRREASTALHTMATKGISVSIVDLAPTSPTPQVYLGEQYVNNPLLSDVTFIVEGKRFYAHRACLLSSDIFRAMFDGGYMRGMLLDCETQIERLLATVFENYKSLDENLPTGLTDHFGPASDSAAPALHPALQTAARKRCRKHMMETDEFLLGA